MNNTIDIFKQVCLDEHIGTRGTHLGKKNAVRIGHRMNDICNASRNDVVMMFDLVYGYSSFMLNCVDAWLREGGL